MLDANSNALNDSNAAMSVIRSLAASGGEDGLTEVASLLQQLASSPHWKNLLWPAALPGEELLYELAVSPGCASLYLVSDGSGVISPPHEHGTWAVIAGLRGKEANCLYQRVVAGQVVPMERVVVGPGEFMVLASTAIHSTEVVGTEPTFHLHLYGKPLNELASFGSRVFARHDAKGADA
jgi:predicted metal-dependent enzyme (double-stranded beta helix superfamily)